MNFSISMDFDEGEVGQSIDNLADLTAPPEDLPEIKFRVPSAPFLESQNIKSILQPYEHIIDQIQALLLLRRPVQFGLLAFLCESFLFICYFAVFNFFQFIIFITALYFLTYILINKYSSFIKDNLFPEIEDRGNEDEPNRIYSLDDISSLLSVFGSRIHTFFLGCKQKAEDPTVFGQIVWIVFVFCFFVIAVIVRTFPLFFLIQHTILFLPGLIFHPQIYPSAIPWLQKLMTTIAPKIKDD